VKAATLRFTRGNFGLTSVASTTCEDHRNPKLWPPYLSYSPPAADPTFLTFLAADTYDRTAHSHG
jgi:hypothetical protein